MSMLTAASIWRIPEYTYNELGLSEMHFWKQSFVFVYVSEIKWIAHICSSRNYRYLEIAKIVKNMYSLWNFVWYLRNYLMSQI